MTLDISIRRAQAGEISSIYHLLQPLSLEGKLLPRDEEQIKSDIKNTWVAVRNQQFVGTVCLIPFSPMLWEVRALAVASGSRKSGIGKLLVQESLRQHRKSSVASLPYRVFALTYVPEFFVHLGFSITNKENFPEKVYEVCQFCARRHDCQETAVEFIER